MSIKFTPGLNDQPLINYLFQLWESENPFVAFYALKLLIITFDFTYSFLKSFSI